MTTIEINNFNLQQIAESGQCFRMNCLEPGRYSAVSKGLYLEVSQEGQLFHFHCPGEDFPFWHRYFDLSTDYGAILSSVRKRDAYLQEAARAGSGIRILNQNTWEMIITFIISQQRTIPKIREAVENLSRLYGEEKHAVSADGHPVVYYAFPSPSQLKKASLEDLLSLKLGYRARYIHRICRDADDGTLDLVRLSAMSYKDAMEYLSGFYGIGTKVANCICLFGLHHIEAFPVDTWIQQILTNHYYRKKYDSLPKNRLYETMVQEHFGKYKGCAGVMQQYIFYYERTVLHGKSANSGTQASDATSGPL